MKKIIIFARSLGCGGTEKALVSLLNAIDYSKYQVTLKLLEEDDFYRKQVPGEVKVGCLEFSSKWVKFLVGCEKDVWHRMVRKVYKLITRVSVNGWQKKYRQFYKYAEQNQEHYDMALDFHGYGYFCTSYVADCIDADFKATWFHDEVLDWTKNVEDALEKYNRFYCVSGHVQKVVNSQLPKLADRTEVFYNIIDLKKTVAEGNKGLPPFDRDVYNIVSVGRLAHQKGYDFTLEIAAYLKVQAFKFCWYIIGDGEKKAELKRMADKLGVSDVVKLTGRLDNPAAYVKNANVYVQTSRHEGFGIAIAEARALKKVVVATQLDVIAEQISDGVNGFLCPWDVTAFAQRIMEVCEGSEAVDKVRAYMETEEIDYSREIEKLGLKG